MGKQLSKRSKILPLPSTQQTVPVPSPISAPAAPLITLNSAQPTNLSEKKQSEQNASMLKLLNDIQYTYKYLISKKSFYASSSRKQEVLTISQNIAKTINDSQVDLDQKQLLLKKNAELSNKVLQKWDEIDKK